MVYDGNKVLVQEKIDDDYRGVTFPGGHVEKGESFTDAVIREVFEETGLRISSPILCGIKDWSNDDGSRYMVLFYKTNKFEGNLSASAEGEVYWTEIEDMKKAIELNPENEKQINGNFDNFNKGTNNVGIY